MKEQMSKSSHFGGILVRDGEERLIDSHLDAPTVAQISTADAPCLGEDCKMVFRAVSASSSRHQCNYDHTMV